MAHELEIVNGVAQMAYVGETPWHGLGTRVPADVSPAQMLEKAGLDWTVEKKPLFFDNLGESQEIEQRALVRTSDNKVMTIVSDEWKPVQNVEAFEFFNDFVAAGEMSMHTAGSLKDGKMVWALAKVQDSFELFGGDTVESYLLFSNPHEFGRSIDIRFTPIRVVCNNTLTMSLAGQASNGVRINHRQTFDGDLVKEMLGVAKDKLASYKEQAAFLGSKRFSNETLTEYFNRVFPSLSQDKDKVSRQADDAMNYLHSQPGAEFAEGSWWQAFNTVTYMTDHVMGRSADTRLTSAWYGLNKSKKEKALELAIDYAEAA
jgi:phage/plasmid-like protein (TIGR03299 family)